MRGDISQLSVQINNSTFLQTSAIDPFVNQNQSTPNRTMYYSAQDDTATYV